MCEKAKIEPLHCWIMCQLFCMRGTGCTWPWKSAI